jgi:hypothetical protein
MVLLLLSGFRFAHAAQDPLVLLEKAIYTEETLGNLGEAISLYQQVVVAVEATRPTSALALLRLGMCYVKSGDAERSQAAFSKLLSLYPEQQDVIALIPAPSPGALGLKPPPWINGEVLNLTVGKKGGLPIGTRTCLFKLASGAGRKVWNLQAVLSDGRFDLINESVLMDAATFAPIRSIIKEESVGREFRASYDSKQIEFSMSIHGESGKKIIPLTQATYDDLQLIPFLRCLPLQEGFRTSFPIFSSGPLLDAQVEVVAKEKITVPAGTFDCYKIILTRGNQSPSSTYWISADFHSYLVKARENRLWRGTVPQLLDLELSSVGIAGN